MPDASMSAVDTQGRRLGLVDGSIKITTQRFTVVLEEDAVVQLDDLVTVTRSLPDDTALPHFGIVVERTGETGAHASISGIGGVPTKRSYATFLLYMLLETEQGGRMLREYAPQTKALVFNVKSEALLHLDRRNRRFDEKERARTEWAALG